MNPEGPFLLAYYFAKRGLDDPASFKSFADNFRDYTLFGLLSTFTLLSIQNMSYGWEFFLVIIPSIGLPFVGAVLFCRTYLLVKSLFDEVLTQSNEWWLSVVFSALLALSYAYVIVNGIRFINAK